MTEKSRDKRGAETSGTGKKPAATQHEQASGEPRQQGGAADPRDRRVEAGRKATSSTGGSGHAR